MDAILVSAVGLVAVAILIYILLKKNDIKMTLLSLGIILMYIAILLGNKIKVSAPTGLLGLIHSKQLLINFLTRLSVQVLLF